jgi:tetraacyldisaccharide 4'-kinase
LIFIFEASRRRARGGKVTMGIRRILLAPLGWSFGGALWLRHLLYDLGIRKSVHPAVPTIAIGNLSFGGTGKTPVVEWVLRTLGDVAPVAVLSRGYGRKGSNFREVMATDNADLSGDEPLQVKRKFPGVRVFVGADRVRAIERIQALVPGVRAVVLDDALQHRRLEAGLNILLTTWQRPWCDDALFPAGGLRDLPARRKAAHMVLVTKCPYLPGEAERVRWRARLGLRPGQALFFAGIEHEEPRLAVEGRGLEVGHKPPPSLNLQHATGQVLLFTGIADPQPLLNHLRKSAHVEHLPFPDHHPYTPSDLARIAARYATFAAGPKALVTTEKDAARLGSLEGTPLQGLPVMVIGMRAVVLNEPERSAELIRRHVGAH